MKGVRADTESVSLKFYHSAYSHQLKKYHLSIEDREFTGMPMESIRICSGEKNRIPIIIDYNGLAVGYFVLHGWDRISNYTDNEFALLLRTYSIDSRYQGKGLAKQSMKLFPDFVSKHFPYVNEIVLAVNHRNAAAQQLYKQGGFADTGKRIMGRKGEQLVYHMKL
jgi:RimJ/RimL family protein N-acetyltransferase